MDFELTDEQQLIRDAVREFAEAEVAPIAGELDRDHRFPHELLPRMAELNIMGMPFPEKCGGAGADETSYVLAVEEISRACASTGCILSAHTSLATWPVYKFGTDAQKDRYLTDMASGRRLGAFALTEPGAGTDAGSGTCTATLHGDEYALNGSKIFITNAPFAEVYIVFAKTDPERGTRGMSAFIVEKDTPGFSVGEAEHKLGIRGSSTPPLYFSDCRVPRDALLGEEGDGFKIAMQTLDGGRIGIAAQALGIAQAALDASVAYAKERVQFGKPIAANAGHPVDDRRHGDRGGRRPPPGLPRGMVRGQRPRLRHRRSDGQAVRLGGRHQGGRPGHPDSRRIRLHGKLPGGAELPRRQDHRDLRGHFRGAAHGDSEKLPAVTAAARKPPSGGS